MLLEQCLWAATAVIGLLIIAGAVVAIFGIIRAPEALSKIALEIIRSDGVTQTIVALVVIMATIGLMVVDKIPAAAGVGVLSSIVSYILGARKRRFYTPPNSN